jgi:hypothetical protein
MCFEIYYNKFPLHFLIENNLDDLISTSALSADENQITLKSHSQKIEYFYLTKFYNKSVLFFNDLTEEYTKNPKNDKILQMKKIADLFILANKEFEVDYRTAVEIFKNNFKFIKDEEIIEFESFMEFFKTKRKFSIRVIQFLEITFDFMVNMYRTIESQIKLFCLNCKEIANNCLVYKDFEEVLTKLIPNFENKWMINDYFK